MSVRNQIKEGLLRLTEKNVRKFKRMYSFEDMNANITDVVNNIPEEDIDWAMQQVLNTITKNKEAEHECEAKV